MIVGLQKESKWSGPWCISICEAALRCIRQVIDVTPWKPPPGPVGQALDYQTAWPQGIESNHISSRAIFSSWGNHFRTLTWLLKTNLLTCLDFKWAKVPKLWLPSVAWGWVPNRDAGILLARGQSWAMPKKLIFPKYPILLCYSPSTSQH